MENVMNEKSKRVHALVNTGPWPGMSEAFDAHMGAACWTDPAYAPDAATWAAAWKAGAAVSYAHGAAVVDKCNSYIVDNARLAEEVDRLREALTRGEAQYPDMQRDAERYRWLRLQDWDTSRLAVVANPRAALKLGHDAPSRDRLDAMIDVHLAEVQGFLDHTLDGLDLGPNVADKRPVLGSA